MTAQRLEGATTGAEKLPELHASIASVATSSAARDEHLVALNEHVVRLNARLIALTIAITVVVISAATIWAVSH